MKRPLFLIPALALFSIAAAKCMIPESWEGSSPNGRVKVRVTRDGVLQIRGAGKAVLDAKVNLPGHHIDVFATDAGDRVVLADRYGGVAVFDGRGTQVNAWKPTQLLTKQEAARRFNSFACHPEGVWAKSVRFDGVNLLYSVPSGRTAQINVRSGAANTAPPALNAAR